MKATHRDRWPAIAAAGVLALLVVALYAPVVDHGFVHFDDDLYIVENAQVRRGLTWEGVGWALTTGHAANWHPLTWLSHMLDYELFGLDAGRHHLVSVLLHAASAALLLWLLRSTTGALWPSALAAALFALHPLRVESVAWAAERKDLLAGLLFFAALLAHASYARRPGPLRYALTAGAMALGLMAKPMLVTLPVVLLLVDYWPLGRVRVAGAPGAEAAFGSKPFRALVLEKLPLVALAALSVAITLVTQSGGGTVGSLAALPLAPRLANALGSYVAYLGQMLWPVNLAFFYPHPATSPSASLAGWYAGAALAGGLLAATTFLFWRWRVPRPHLVVGWLWYLATLAPVIGIVQAGNQARADRFTYLPLVGIAIAVAWSLRELALRRPRAVPALVVAAAVGLAALTVATRRQIGHWRDGRTLAEQALRATSANYEAYNLLGVTLMKRGDLEGAAAAFERGVELDPTHPVLHHNLGAVRVDQGRPADGERHFREALAANPRYAEAHNNLGVLLERRGLNDEARRQYETAVSLAPSYAIAHKNLAALAQKSGDLAGAERHFRRAIELDPGFAEAHAGLGQALLARGQATAAAVHLVRAVRLAPTLAEARRSLGALLFERGELAGAAEQFEILTRLAPDDAVAHYNLGVVRSRQQRIAEAAERFEQALRLQPDLEAARRALSSLGSEGGGPEASGPRTDRR